MEVLVTTEHFSFLHFPQKRICSRENVRFHEVDICFRTSHSIRGVSSFIPLLFFHLLHSGSLSSSPGAKVVMRNIWRRKTTTTITRERVPTQHIRRQLFSLPLSLTTIRDRRRKRREMGCRPLRLLLCCFQCGDRFLDDVDSHFRSTHCVQKGGNVCLLSHRRFPFGERAWKDKNSISFVLTFSPFFQLITKISSHKR